MVLVSLAIGLEYLALTFTISTLSWKKRHTYHTVHISLKAAFICKIRVGGDTWKSQNDLSISIWCT